MEFHFHSQNFMYWDEFDSLLKCIVKTRVGNLKGLLYLEMCLQDII